MKVFIDSNVPMYVAGRDHPNKPPARRFLDRVRTGGVRACTSTEVLQEILYRYHALDRPDLAGKVYDLFVETCPEVLPVTLADTDRARALLDEHPGLPVRDAVHAAVMAGAGLVHIASFDRHFDDLEEVGRIPMP